MGVDAMCATAGGDVAIRVGLGFGWLIDEIKLCDRKGRTRTTYTGLCTRCGGYYKHISELIPGQYLAELCSATYGCNEIKVVDMVTHKVQRAYSGSSSSMKLHAMCSGPVEGSLLVADDKSQAVIQLQWDEGQKQLKEVRREQLPGSNVLHMCYMAHTDLLILSGGGRYMQAVKLQAGAGQAPVWQLQGKVLGKEIKPRSVSCDSEGRVYVADGNNSRVLLLDGSTGEVIQQLLQDAGLEDVFNVCCLSNPHQLLVYHQPPPDKTPTLSLYNITSLESPGQLQSPPTQLNENVSKNAKLANHFDQFGHRDCKNISAFTLYIELHSQEAFLGP